MSKEDKEFDVAEDFNKSKLGGKSMLFTNNVGMFLVRNKNNNYDAISEAITWLGDAVGCLPEGSTIDISGLQVVLKTKDDLTDDAIEQLENYGYLFQSAYQSKDNEGNEVWYSTFFLQSPEYWDSSFDDFLKTYPDFLRKKYSRMRSPKKELFDFVEKVKKFDKEFIERWSRK